MITRNELIQMLLKEYDCEVIRQIAKIALDKLSDSFLEKELPVKCMRKGYFVIG